MELVVDHDDNDKLNNRVDNINIVSHRINSTKDRWRIEGTSKYLGVSYSNRDNHYTTSISKDGKSIHVGIFKNELDANNAYQDCLDNLYNDEFNWCKYKFKFSSKYHGVTWDKSRFKWMARIKNKTIGRYNTEELANDAVIKYLCDIN
jgi:hypothetical protein